MKAPFHPQYLPASLLHAEGGGAASQWELVLCELDEPGTVFAAKLLCFWGEISPGMGGFSCLSVWGRFAAGSAAWSGPFVLVSVSWPPLSSNFASSMA